MTDNSRVTLRDIYDQIDKLESKMEANYVQKSEFAPVRSLVYGMVGLVMMAVGTAIVATVIKAAGEVIK
jgi:hypothetical protein